MDANSNSNEPAEGLAQLELKMRLEQIAEHRREAEQREAGEDWHGAAEHYAAALELDSTLVFARQGKARALARAQLADGMAVLIAEPQRLGTDTVYNEATALLDQAAQIGEQGPRHRAQLRALSRDQARARTPVRVRLQSDNLTEVVVYKVTKLGNFTSRELELIPGTYTVIGTRSGYRDVRRQFTVVAGKSPAPIVVRCEEKI